MGLLDNILANPEANNALAAGLLSGNFGAGLLGMNQVMARQQDQAMRKKALDSQMMSQALQQQQLQMELDAARKKLSDDETAKQTMIDWYAKRGLPGATTAGQSVAAPTLGGTGGMGGGGIPGAGPAVTASSVGGVPGKASVYQQYTDMAEEFARKGLVGKAQEYSALAEKYRPKYSTTPQVVRDPQTGQLVNVLLSEDGTTQVLPFGVKPNIKTLTLGDRIESVDENNMRGGETFRMGQSPDSKASNAVAWANYGLSKQRLAMEQSAPKGQYDPERGVLVDPRTGVASPVMMGGQPLGAKEKPLTDTQAKALQFSSRMENSHQIMGELASKGAVNVIPGTNAGYGVGRAIRAISPAENQQLEQAQRDFVNAILRRESGAAISPTEYESASLQYFPQIGDDAKTIAQKAKNREIAIAGLKAEVPKGAPSVDQFMPKKAPPVPMKGLVRDGYRFKGGDPADQNNWEKQ